MPNHRHLLSLVVLFYAAPLFGADASIVRRLEVALACRTHR